jgi:LysM repeat protein
MNHATRRIGYTSLTTGLLAVGLGLTFCGCQSKPGLLSDRDGIVPPPYQAPVSNVPSPEPMVPTFSGGAGTAFFEAPAPGAVIDEPPAAEEAVPAGGGIVLPEVPKTEQLTHTVARGESLWLIAKKYGVSYQELASVNNMDVNAVLTVGKLLVIPPGGRPGAAGEGRAPTVKSPAVGMAGSGSGPVSTYVVQKGDCLSKIASRCNMKTSELMALNGLKSDKITVGQKLKVRGTVEKPSAPTLGPVEPKEPATKKPDVAPPVAPTEPTADEGTTTPPAAVPTVIEPAATNPAPQPAPEETKVKVRELPHDVCKDDTLANIAEMYGTTVQSILQANPDVKTDADLKVGNTIMVPYK